MLEDSRDAFGRIQGTPVVIVGGFNNEPGLNPPADDVREALVRELRLWAKLIGTEPRGARDLFNRAADAIAEVRPRGTVTDAEVEAAWNAMDNQHGAINVTYDDVRLGLEAARSA